MKDSPRPPIGASPPESTGPTKKEYDGDPSRLVRWATDQDRDKPHPLYVVWEITLQCDLGCKHCGSRAGKIRNEELNTAQCLDVVKQMSDAGVREVTLIGGEAYLRDDWHIIARAITDSGMSVGMTTGARNLTQERVDQAVDAGLRTVSISIDGLEQTHDAQRGARGSWRSALDAAERISKSPIRLATNTQINKLSMPELPALADLLVEIGSKAWQIQLTVAMGRAADRPEMLLQPYDLLELFPLLVWIKQTKLEPNKVQLFPGNNIGYFGPYEHLLRYGGDRGAHWSGCAAGLWTLGLEADGKIKGCPSLPSNEYTGGNFKTDKLADVIERTEELTWIKGRTRDDLWGYCHECYYGDICKAGCTWTSHCLLGKPGNNPYCIHRALQFEADGKRERVVKVEDAPGDPFDNGRFEIVVEPIGGGVEAEIPTVLGLALDDVVSLETSAGSVWSKEERKDRLARHFVDK